MSGLFNSVVDPLFRPLLSMNLFLAIALVSFVMSLIITIVYKYMTDQNLMKDLKDELKTLQKQMKELRDHPEKMMKVQKQVMETNMKYMMHSMKPTLVTFIPIIIIFGWLSAHLAFMPLIPGEEFTVTAEMEEGISGTVSLAVPEGITLISKADQDIVGGSARWSLKGDAGEYIIEFSQGENKIEKDLMIDTTDYAPVEFRAPKGSIFDKVRIGNEKTKPFGNIPIFGWVPGWLACYIILSIAFSMGLRKVLKIY